MRNSMMSDTELNMFTLGDAVDIFRRRWRLAVFTFIAILIPAVLVTFLMPPLYQADARLWVDRNMPSADYSVDTNRGGSSVTTFRNMNREEEISTQAEMIRSRVIMEAVAAKLELTQEKLNNIRDFRRYVRAIYVGILDGARWTYNEFKYLLHLSRRPTPEEQAFLEHTNLIDDAIDRIRVQPASDSNVLLVSFRSSDPELARDVVNAMVDEFMSFSSEMKQARALNFFSDSSKKLAADLADAEKTLLALRAKTMSYAPEQQRGLLLSQMAEASERVRSLEVAKAEIEGRIEGLEARLSKESKRVVVRQQNRRNPVVDSLSAKLAELNHRRAIVNKNGDSDSIPARKIDAEIAAIKAELSGPPKNVADITVTELNPIYQQLTEQLMRSEVELAALRKQTDMARQVFAQYQTELSSLAEGDLQVKEAERRVKHIEEIYDLHLRNREEAQISEDRSMARLSDVRIIDYAPYPLKPVRPRTLLYLGIGLGAALLLAVGIPFLAFFNDTTIVDARDVRKHLGVSFVASFSTRPTGAKA